MIRAWMAANGRSWEKYWESQKLLEYTSRSGLDVLETKSGSSFNAKLMPVIGKVDVNNYANLDVADFAVADASGFIETEVWYDGTVDKTLNIFSSSDTAGAVNYILVYIFYGYITLAVRGAVGGAFQNVVRYQLPAGAAWYKFRFTSNGSAYSLLVNDVPQTLAVVAGLNNGKWFDKVAGRDNISIGVSKRNTLVRCDTSGYVSYVSYGTANKWIPTGFGTKIFDVIGNQHLTWIGTAHADFKGVDGHCLNIGYSVWQKAESVDEYVPYASANTPYDASATLTGYVKYKDFPGSTTVYNFYPSLLGFNETGSDDSRLEIFDRSNTTRQSAASRAATFYDVTSLATKCRYYCAPTSSPFTPEFNYSTLRSFFNEGYKHRVFPVQNAALVTAFSGVIVTKTDLSGNNLEYALNVAKYNEFIAFGDSITSGPSATTRYSYYIAADKSCIEINKGVPSDAVQIELLARVSQLNGYAENARIFILCGINDIDHLVYGSPQGTDEAFVAAYESIIDTLVSYGYLKANIYISTLTWLKGDSWGYREHVVPYNTLISGIASRKGVNLIDLYSATLNQATYYTGAEELHPNAVGHQAMANQIISDINWWT